MNRDKKSNVIYLTREDFAQLESVLDTNANAETAARLEEEMARARVVSAEGVDPSVVTMNSRVKYADSETGKLHEVELVFPGQADISKKKVSVLAPVGVALLGLSRGQA